MKIKPIPKPKSNLIGLPSSPSPKGSMRKRATKAIRHEKHSSKDKPSSKRKTELMSGKKKSQQSNIGSK